MRTLLPLSALLFATVSPAQMARDEWLVSTFTSYISSTPVTGGIWHVDAARTTATQLAGQTPNMAGANAVAIDENGIAFYGTLQTASVPIPNPGSILQIIVSAGTVVSETLLTTTPIDTGSVSAICIVRDRIWFVTDAGNVGWIPKAGGAPTIVLNLSAAGVRGLGQSITSNGREIFVGTSHTTSTPDPANVWELDGLAATPTLRPLVFMNGSAFALTMARDNMVLAGRISGQLWLIDPVAATGAQLNVGATAPQSNSNGTALNPWLNVACNVAGYGGTTPRDISFYDVATNTWPVQLTIDTSVPSGAASSHEEPFQYFGQGCVGANGLEPRMGWTGIPMQGQSFTLSIRNGEANSVGFLFLGFSNTVGNIGPLPASLGFLGATGCSQLVSDDAFTTFLLQNGTASQTLNVPVNPALAGWTLYSQWALTSTVNSFGFVTSDAVQINFR